MNPQQLPFGRRDGKLFHITDVENGLACGCSCPNCGSRLVARNRGKKRIAHFAHLAEPGSLNCVGALETAVHQKAKEILQSANDIVLPGISQDIFQKNKPTMVLGSYSFHYTEASVEHSLGDCKPDALLTGGEDQLAVEIFVTHAVDEEKKAKLVKHGISTIEIHLENLRWADYDPAKLEDYVLNRTELKTWVFNGKQARIEAAAQRASERLGYHQTAGVFFCPAKARLSGKVCEGEEVHIVEFRTSCLDCGYLGATDDSKSATAIRCFATSGVASIGDLYEFEQTGQPLEMREALLPATPPPKWRPPVSVSIPWSNPLPKEDIKIVENVGQNGPEPWRARTCMTCQGPVNMTPLHDGRTRFECARNPNGCRPYVI